ncbi:hypothetical protein [Kribbella sp. NPDC051718]|uniref:hypothetical protein n=1 Tax=Kribbella sp. NPDC051718 TaxID=3155168 RepID=UPI00342D0988
MTTEGIRPHRRVILQGAVATGAVLTAELTQSAQASAAPPVPKGITPVGPMSTSRLVQGPQGASVEVPAALGALLTVGTSGVPAGAVVALTYDSRLYFAAPRSVLVRGSRLIPVHGVPKAGPGHAVRLEVRLPQLPAGEYTLQAGALKPQRFPADLVTDPLPVQVEVVDLAGATTARALSRPTAKKDVPWGVQLGAGWQQAAWGDGFSVWYPTLVTAHSVGPGVVPAGSRIRISLDRQVFESVEITAATDSDGKRVLGLPRRGTSTGRATATWTSHAPVEADARVTLICRTEVRELSGPLDTLAPPLVEFLPPKRSRDSQRPTGQESQTRSDDIYSTATRAAAAPA